MRWNEALRIVTAWSCIGFAASFVTPDIAAEEPRAGTRDDRMAAVIAAVQAEEARFQDIEYAVRITVGAAGPPVPAGVPEFTTLAMRLAIFQGDRTYFRNRSFERTATFKFHREEISAYDGDRTRSVIAGNCVNIHPGRWDHPDLYSAHSLSLAHCRVNFPLSVFLAGTEAIHADRRYPRDLAEFGSPDAFAEVKARLEPDEEVDGLRCLKVRVERRYSGDVRAVQYLWLATGRNYHCIKERFSWPEGRFGDLPAHDMRVEELRELVPGVWLPIKISVVQYDALEPGRGPEVISRAATFVDKVELAPRHEAAFFRDVAMPADLPVFTVKDRQLSRPTPPAVADDDLARAKLADLAARVATEQKHFDNIEVKAHEIWKDLNPDSLEQNRVAERSQMGRSIQRGDLASSTGTCVLTLRDGTRTELFRTIAFDGHSTRTVGGNAAPDARRPQVVLRAGRTALDRVLREADCPNQPHTLVLRDYPFIPTLGSLLEPLGTPPTGRFACRLRYAGSAKIDGHSCIALRGDLAPGLRGRSGGVLVVYLATDRNHIPIRMEYYNAQIGGQYVLSQIAVADDLHEIAAGIWYPFRATGLGFETGPRRARGSLVVAWRHDTTIDSATLSPRVDESLFRDVSPPAGPRVQAIDQDR